MHKIAIIATPNCVTKHKKIKESLYTIKNSSKKVDTMIMSTDNPGIESDVGKMCEEMGLMFKESTASSNAKKEHSIIQRPEHYSKKRPHFTQTIFKYNVLIDSADIIVFATDEGSDVSKLYVDLLKKAQTKNKKIIFV